MKQYKLTFTNDNEEILSTYVLDLSEVDYVYITTMLTLGASKLHEYNIIVPDGTTKYKLETKID